MADGMDLKNLKKKNKTAISITINTENLEFLKEDMKKEGVEGMPLSLVFDNFLEDFVRFRKSMLEKDARKNKEEKKDDDTKEK